MPSHVGTHLSLPVPPWLGAKRLNLGRAKPVWQILSCRSRAEGPGVGGLDLPSRRNAQPSGIWTKASLAVSQVSSSSLQKMGSGGGR